MIKQFTVNCNFKSAQAPVTFYIGDPSDESDNPIYFQSRWLNEKKGGTVPKEITESFVELQKIASNNRISCGELCEFLSEEMQNEQLTLNERDRINKNLKIIQKHEEQKNLTQSQTTSEQTTETTSKKETISRN